MQGSKWGLWGCKVALTRSLTVTETSHSPGSSQLLVPRLQSRPVHSDFFICHLIKVTNNLTDPDSGRSAAPMF